MPYRLTTATKTSLIASGTVSGSAVEMPGWEIIGCDVPALTSATLQFFVSVDGTTYRGLKDGLGNTLLLFPAGTGNFCIASRDLADLGAYPFVMPVAGASQTGGAVTITFYFWGTP